MEIINPDVINLGANKDSSRYEDTPSFIQFKYEDASGFVCAQEEYKSIVES